MDFGGHGTRHPNLSPQGRSLPYPPFHPTRAEVPLLVTEEELAAAFRRERPPNCRR